MTKPLPRKALIAMIALRPLPESPLYDGDDHRIVDQALSDLELYKSAGVDSVLLENDHDLPYVKGPLPAAAVEMVERVAKRVRARFDGPIGLQLLEAANDDALSVANESGLDYLRVEGFVYAHVGGAGIIEACAGTLLRKRARLACEDILIYADIDKKHCAHAISSDLDITLEAKQAELFMADGLVVTGNFTGESAAREDLAAIRKASGLPILVGSGMTADNIGDFFPLADAFIVGSTFRKNGDYLERLDRHRLDAFMEVFSGVRAGSI